MGNPFALICNCVGWGKGFTLPLSYSTLSIRMQIPQSCINRCCPIFLKPLAALLVLIASSSVFAQDLVINEFMAINETSLIDGDGDRSDWIEIFNGSPEAIDLSGYALSDDGQTPAKWELPEGTTLGAGGYLIVFASGKDRAVAGEPLHTNFKLGGSEKFIGLFDRDGQPVHSYSDLPPQRADVSYGLGTSGETIPNDFIPDSSAATWLVPSEDIGDDWKQPEFDDSSWTAAKLGLGFDYDEITGENGHLQAAMQGKNASVYVRVPFEIENAARVVSLDLDMRFEDGFVAFLNGHEIASFNKPSPLQWDSTSDGSHSDSDAVIPKEFSIEPSEFAGRLVSGTNILAIQGMNTSRGGSDLLVYPNLSGRTTAADEASPGYFESPTPGLANASKVDGFVTGTTAQPARGFYEQPFQVTIANDTEGAKIYYTMDQTEPTPEDGTLYTGPINIDKTTVLRISAHLPGHVASPIETHTYLFLDDVIQQRTMKTSVTEDDELGPQMRDSLTSVPTISIVSTETRELLQAQSTGGVPSVEQPEVTCSAEWLNPDGSEGFHINCGIARFGGFFTNFPKKSYRLFFRKKYGDGTLKYPVFDGFEYDIPPVDEFDALSLRSGSHDMQQRGAYMSNRFVDDTLLDMGQLAPHGRFVHVYINGDYWGQYHLRERWHAAMFARYFGGEKNDYEAINGDNSGSEFLPGNPYDGSADWYKLKLLRLDSEDDLPDDGEAELIVSTVAGELYVTIFSAQGRKVEKYETGRRTRGFKDVPELGQLKQFMQTTPLPDVDALPEEQRLELIDWALTAADHTPGDLWDQATKLVRDGAREDDTYNFVKSHVDIENYVDWMIMWASGNSESEFRSAGGRSLGAPPTSPLEVGFKFFLKDADGYLRGHQTGRATHNGPMRLFSELRRDKDPEYLTLVGDRIHKHFFNGGAMTTEKLVERLQKRVDETTLSFIAESARWNFRSYASWSREVNTTYIGRNLPRVEAAMLRAYERAGLYPEVVAPVFSQHGGTIPESGSIQVTADGVIYYTTDGSDPRMPGGAINPSASVIDGRGELVEFIKQGSVWKYLDDGSEQGASWRATAFDDTAWKQGAAQLGYGDRDEATVVEFGPSASKKFITTYFRHSFDVQNVDRLTDFTVDLLRDDGAIIYVNGQEVVRDNLPAGDVDSTTLAGDDTKDEDEFYQFVVDSALLVNGTNVIAVEVHQEKASSSDMSFDFKANGIYSSGTPTVVLDGPTEVNARVLDGDNWSALNVAFFSPAAVKASKENLVISEFMYHPADATDAEVQAGYTNRDRFEYVELQNISDSTLDLTEVEFVDGIDAVIPTGSSAFLGAGSYALLVKDVDAFTFRYGAGLPVIGSFTGNLRNSGETVELVGSEGEIRTFEYDDADPWPSEADGEGPGLELFAPNSNPDHAVAASWRATEPGGTPGRGSGDVGPGYVAWKGTVFTAEELADPTISGDLVDNDGDGLTVFMEFVNGGSPKQADYDRGLNIIRVGDELHLTYVRNTTAAGVAVSIEQSSGLIEWQNAGASLQQIGAVPVNATDDRITLKYVGTDNPSGYFRLKASSN